MSITESQVGNRSFERKNASFSATVPSTFPGKTRLKFCPFGQSLVPAADARIDKTGMIKISPCTSATSKRRDRSSAAVCPSYSSPWFPESTSTRGPLPFFTEVMGTQWLAQPLLLVESPIWM